MDKTLSNLFFDLLENTKIGADDTDAGREKLVGDIFQFEPVDGERELPINDILDIFG